MTKKYLKDLPSDGKTGEWGFSISPKVIIKHFKVQEQIYYITQELVMVILEDLDKFLTQKKISRPIILWLDCASPNISIGMARFCKEKGIQPWLLRPNTTHVLQPLDLTFFKSLKIRLQQKIQQWHQVNIGTSLTKYSVVPLL